ncbi:MAG: hypothetical protein ACEQSB_04145 [Undibacterium sp.]
MLILIYISLAVNVVVAGFWGIALGFNLFPQQARVYGLDSPGLRILGSVYLAIASLSVFALFSPPHLITIITVLFPLQILYKVLTLKLVGDSRHPVVIANGMIAVLLAVTWYFAVGKSFSNL